jgi:hypothetical protein
VSGSVSDTFPDFRELVFEIRQWRLAEGILGKESWGLGEGILGSDPNGTGTLIEMLSTK